MTKTKPNWLEQFFAGEPEGEIAQSLGIKRSSLLRRLQRLGYGDRQRARNTLTPEKRAAAFFLLSQNLSPIAIARRLRVRTERIERLEKERGLWAIRAWAAVLYQLGWPVDAVGKLCNLSKRSIQRIVSEEVEAGHLLRFCRFCRRPLLPDSHLNRHYHPRCARYALSFRRQMATP